MAAGDVPNERTWPERALAGALRRLGFQVRQNVKELPGSPDIVLRGLKAVVMVHGCFWHGCPEHYKAPKSNPAFWRDKVARNRARDRVSAQRLRLLGWRVVVVWEHELRQAGPGQTAARVVARLA